MKFITATLLIFLFSNLNAQEQEAQHSLWQKTKDLGAQAVDEAREAADELQASLKRGPQHRENRDLGVTASYSYFDTWTLGKWGASVAFQEVDHSIDIDYQQGSLGLNFIADLGGIKDRRLSVLKRSYGQRSSFHWIYGGYYSQFKIQIGDEIMSNVSQGAYPNADLVDVQMLGFSLGAGNRWQRGNGFTFGVDWVQVNIPIFTLKDEASILSSDADPEDKEDVDNVVAVFKRIPTFSILKMYVGYSF